MTGGLTWDGYVVFPSEESVLRWADAAKDVAEKVLQGPGERRHGSTWFVGVDALPNATDGAVCGVPLAGRWLDHIIRPLIWHRAQLSVVFPGYPGRDADESEVAHRYRRRRDSAHVDGLLPIGPEKRRYLREPHGFVVGFSLNDIDASPLVVWRGSHRVMARAFSTVLQHYPPSDWHKIDLTETYQAARRTVFETCERIPLRYKPGQAVLLHRHLLHGVAPWGDCVETTPRMMAYFRPVVGFAEWLG